MGKTADRTVFTVECNNHNYYVISTVSSSGGTTSWEQCSICGKKRIKVSVVNKIDVVDE